MLNYKLTILIVIRYTIANQNSCINIYTKSTAVFHFAIILNINIVFVIFEFKYTLSKFYLILYCVHVKHHIFNFKY